MNSSSYQIELPQDSEVVVFYNGIKALNTRGIFWLWRQIIAGKMLGIKKVKGCVDVKLCICSHQEAIIVSYWQTQSSLTEFYRSPLHRQMMQDTKNLLRRDSEAISLFNEVHRPTVSGRYFNEPQGLAKIYPAV
ncbi:MAG: DUF4188 domain-containing protein [Cyanobacteria bacterium J06600_6]